MTDGSSMGRPRIHHRVKAHVVRRWENTMASDAKSNIVIAILILLASAGLIAMGYFALHPLPHTSYSVPDRLMQLSAAAVITSPFVCQSGRSIVAVFSNREVRVTLSDGREITLPQVASASGARYSNPDGSFVFVNKGNTASITEFGRDTYVGCLENG